MRFSVLVPTRKGGSLLETCLRSALDQGWEDIEVVVADNCNDDETPEVLARFAGDPRVVITRSEEVLDLCGNWTRALERSSGDYVVVLQDDELLLPGYFEHTDALLREFDEPDCLSYNGYIYYWPGILGSRAYYRDPGWPTAPTPPGCDLTSEYRRPMLERSFRQLGLEFGIQAPIRTLVARRVIERLPIGLFTPPLPDLCAQTSLLITAKSWRIVPDKLVVEGSAPKSFWQYHYRGQRDEGARHLGLDGIEADLPGDDILNSVYLGLQRMKAAYPEALTGIEPDRGLYVVRQLWHWSRDLARRSITIGEFGRRLRLLSARDWIGAIGALPRAEARERLLSLVRHRSPGDLMVELGFVALPAVKNIGEFADWIGQRASRSERMMAHADDQPTRQPAQ